MRKYTKRNLGYLFGSTVFDSNDDDDKLANYYSFAILRLQLNDFICLSWRVSFFNTFGVLKDNSKILEQ